MGPSQSQAQNPGIIQFTQGGIYAYTCIMPSVWGFIFLWITRAAKETLALLGWNPSTALIGLAIVVFGFADYRKKRGQEATSQAFRDYKVWTIWPVVKVAGLVFVLNLVFAPYHLYVDQERRNAEELSRRIIALLVPKDQALQRNAATIKELQDELTRLKSQPQTSVSDQTELARLRAELENREKRRGISEWLARALENGNALLTRCVRERCSEDVEKVVNDWDNETATFIQNNLGVAHLARYRDFSGLPLSGVPVGFPLARTGLYNRIRGRLARLNEFLRELTN
ncbi:MAG: hypothetical protein A3J28_18580 [Acidobacteria bacterium RIFCSPLOWO2_12_FULL_60_22]|nr:MAG: hypothetical protein A3J28_18580 [Acidobacteria bacterium RIFCSPLOWO2_12_FULL_60_22]